MNRWISLKLTHFFLHGVRLHEAEAFYHRVIGLRELWRSDDCILLGKPTGILGFQHEDASRSPVKSPGFPVFETDGCFDDCYRRLQKQGVRFCGGVKRRKHGDRVAWFTNPSDYVHALWEPPEGYSPPGATASLEGEPQTTFAIYFLAVEDVKESSSFYSDVLGLRLIEFRTGVYAVLDAGSLVLGLREGRDAGAGADAAGWAVFETNRGFDGLCATLQGGGRLIKTASGHHGRVGWFNAPGGHIQSLHEPASGYSLREMLQR